MAQKNNIQFNIDFKKGDTKALESLKKDIAEIQRLAGNVDFTGGMETSEIQKMVNAARTLETALDQAFDVDLNAVNVQKFNQILKQSGMSAETLQADLASAGAIGQQAFLKMTGQLMQFNTVTKQTNHFLDNLATTFFNTIKWSVMSSIVNNISGTIQKSFYYIKDLDTALNDIRIVTNKSADDMDRFAVKANDAAKALAVSTQDYAEGSLIYYQQGLDDVTVKTMADITAKTANVTAQSMGTVSEQLTAVWNGYQVANQAAEEGMQVYEEYVDKMAAVGATTASDLEELSTAMSKVASAASAMGVDFDDLNAQIATIVSVTRQAPESVGTALKTIYARLGDLKVDGVDEFGVKLGEITSQMETMGISILDTNGDMRAMSDVMMEVAAKWQTWTSAQRQAAAVAMAGKRQYNNLVALFDNWDMHEKALTTSMEAVGTLNEQQAIALESLANKMEIMEATAQDLYDNLFDEKSLSNLVEAGTKALQLVADLTETLGGLKNILPAIGSLGVSVFSKQIGDGLATIVNNARNAVDYTKMVENNFEQVKLMYADTSLFSNEYGSETQAAEVQKLLDYYKQMYEYQSLMTNEQKEQYNTILNTKVEIGSQVTELETLKNNFKDIGVNLGIVDIKLLDNLDNIKLFSNEVVKISNISEDLQSFLTFNITGGIELEQFKDRLIALKEEGSITDKTLNILVNRFKNYTEAGKSGAEATSLIIKEIKELGTTVSGIGRLNTSIRSLTTNSEKAAEALTKTLDTKKLLTDITRVTSAVGQLASSISMLQNASEVLNNEELSSSEKFTRLATSIGMTTAMLSSSLSVIVPKIVELGPKIASLGQSLNILALNQNKVRLQEEASLALDAKKMASLTQQTALGAIRNKGSIDYANKLLQENGLLELNITELNAKTEAEVKEFLAKQGVTNLSADQIRYITASIVAHNAETVSIEANTAAQEANNAAKMAAIKIALGSVAAVAAIAAAVTILTYKISQLKEEEIKSRQEEQKAFEEQHAEAQQEIQDRQDLAQSYIDLYSQYKDGNAEKSTMIQKTNELVDIFGEERIAVANLTGDYESLNKEMLEYRQNQIQAKMQQNAQEIQEQRKNIDNKYGNILSFTQEDYNKLSDENPLKQALYTNTRLDGSLGYELDLSQVSDEWLAQNIGAINAYLQKTGVDVSEFSRYAGNIRDLYAENQRLQVEEVASTKDLSNVDSYSDYSKILKETIEQLRETGQYGSEGELTQAAIKMLSGLSGNNEAYAERASAENYLLNTKYADNKAIKTALANMMDSLDEDDLTLLLEGKVAIDPNNIEQSITEGLARVKQSFAQEDLSIVNDLREKLISDKKLTNKELEEMLQERKALAQEYATELYDFENKSELEQVQTLNAIARAKMDQNREYAKSQQEYVDDYDEKIEELNQLDLERVKYQGRLTDDQEQRYKELQEYIEANKETYEDYLNEIKSFDLDDSIFNNLMSGMDGIISEAKILKDIAEDVGESWTIAADDIEHFGKNFPEILAAQENYNFLQDGSVQLTKEGQEALQSLVEERKNDLIAQNEAYQLELQKQADIQKATAEYYEAQAAALREYLEKNRQGINIQERLEANLDEYKDKLRETTDMDEAELQKAIQQYLGETVDVAQQDTEKMYDFWVGVGNAAQNAALAYKYKHFEDPGMRPSGGGVGTKTTGGAYSSSEQPEYIEDATNEQIEALIKQYEEAAKKANHRYSDYISKKAGVGAALQSTLNAMDNAAAGKGGKQSKSKGSDKDKSKDEKEYRDEFNRYFDIEKAIDAVDEATKRLQKDQKNLHGKELIASLKKENELIEEQTANYEKLYELQREEASELIGKLKALGVAFDESGAITNYADATKSALKKYNDAVEQYNAGVLDDAAFEIHEKAYENFKKTLERYEELYYKEMIDTQDKIDDNNRKVLENNLKGWETEIQLKLDLQEAERKWADFLHEINKDYKKVYKNVNAEMDTLIKKAKTFTGENGYAGTIATNIEKVTDVTAEIDKLVAGANSSMFESVTQAQEELKKLYDTLMSDAKELENLQEEAWENYLDGIDQVADKFDDLNDRFKRITDELAFQGELIELLYGEEAYSLMNKLYSGQEKSLENQLQSVRQQEQMWKKLFDESGATMQNQSDWTEDQKKYYDQWIAAQDELNDLVIDYIKLLKDDYLNTVKDTLLELEKAIAGARLDDVKTQWERIAANADKYYDSIEGAYEIQKFANKLNEELDKTTDIKNQQRILKFRDKEIGYLREKETLTEYDLQAAEARYQIMLKEMALEDARNNKTSMKLTRNEQGNWSYQYIADEDDVLSKRQELLDSFNNLYQLASDAYEKNLESLQSLQEEYLARSAEIEELALTDKELADQRRAELDAWYFEQYRLLSDENALYRNDLVTSGAALLLEVYNQDVSAYESMTDTEKAMIDALVESHIENYMDLEEKMGENFNNINDMSQELMEKTREDWTSSAQTIADTWNGSHGSSVRSMVLDAHSRISQATDDYKEKVDWCADAVGRDFGPEGITGAIDKASEATVNLKNLTTEMVNESIDGLDRLKSQVGEVENAWKSLMNQIRKAIQLINEYMQKQAQAASMPTAGIDGNGGLGNTDAIGGGSGNGSGGNDNSIDDSRNPHKSLQTTGYYYIAHQSDGSAEVTGTVRDLSTAQNVIKDYRDNNGDGSIYRIIYRGGIEVDRELMPFDTGGYTGEWAGQKDGKLGILHQKELVLNADDTKNFLAGIRTLRDMTNLNGTISGAITNSIANMALKYGMINAGSYGTVSTNSPIGGGDTYYVTAEFPNAENVNEIREALMSLPNIASQYVGRRA